MSTRWGQPHEGCLFSAMSHSDEIAFKNHAFLSEGVQIQAMSIRSQDDDDTDYALSSAHRPRSTSSVVYFHVFLSFADSCSLLVSRFSRPIDWSKVFVDCIHVVFISP